MKKDYAEEFRHDLDEFYEMTEKFYNKEITVPQYKSFSGAFGSYAQRGGERSMLRLRLTGGEISKENLKFIADSIRKYQIDKVHLTTCETVQLHNLTKDTVCDLIKDAFDHGIITRGGGGDYPRNVICSPLSGVDKEEPFDVLPYAKEAADYLLGFIKTVKFPRKLKVCFSNDKENVTHATFRDLGFVAKENQTFDVYAAGGLGNKPKFGVLVAENVEPSKILYCIKTMVDVFTKYGNYENRAASRTRFLQDTLGVDGLKKVFKETLDQNLKEGGLDFSVQDETAERLNRKAKNAEDANSELFENKRVVKQKQNGLYSVLYHPIGGVPDVSFFERLYQTIEAMDEVKVRLTPEEELYVINLTGEEAKKVLEVTVGGANTEFERSTACIGADICQVGVGRSQAMLEACVARVKKENFPDGVLPAIHISGCPSSCSAHQTAVIGLRGAKKPTPDGVKSAFAIFENGCQLPDQERFGKELGVMTEDVIPEFFVALGHAVLETGLSFKAFEEKYPNRVEEIAASYI